MLDTIIKFFTQSSEDPAKTSATLTGILIVLASYVQQFGVSIPFIKDFFASPIGMQSEQILTAFGMIIGGIWFLFGLFRKVTNKVESVTGLAVE